MRTAQKREPFTATKRQPTPAAPLLTIERAIDDGISPKQLRDVARVNQNKGDRYDDDRLKAQAESLRRIAKQIERQSSNDNSHMRAA
jgi:DNA-binding transcriptional regulator YdaS (Cro superfamily)